MIMKCSFKIDIAFETHNVKFIFINLSPNVWFSVPTTSALKGASVREGVSVREGMSTREDTSTRESASVRKGSLVWYVASTRSLKMLHLRCVHLQSISG